jgi:hypothetical protein
VRDKRNPMYNTDRQTYVKQYSPVPGKQKISRRKQKTVRRVGVMDTKQNCLLKDMRNQTSQQMKNKLKTKHPV